MNLVTVIGRTIVYISSGIDFVHERRSQHPNTPKKEANNYKLYQLLDDPKHRGRIITCTYDLGDNWEHHLIVEGRASPTWVFQDISGTGHYVLEDACSDHGWEELKEAYRAARPTAEQR